jgi:hypothetical protein
MVNERGRDEARPSAGAVDRARSVGGPRFVVAASWIGGPRFVVAALWIGGPRFVYPESIERVVAASLT